MAVVDPLEPGVQARTDLHDRRGGMRGQKPAYPEIDDRGAQHGSPPARAPAVLGGVVVDRLQHFHGLGIGQDRVLSPGLAGPGRERDEQGLLNGTEPDLVLVLHPGHGSGSCAGSPISCA